MIVTVIRVRLLHSLRFLLVVSLLALPWWTASRCLGQDKSPQTEEERQARQDLNEGVQAFKNGQHQEAERYFAHAKQLYPKLLNARLYLATTYASQYIPGAPSEESIRMGHAASEEFRGVLSLDPQNISAIDGLGSLLFQMAGSPFDPDLFQESKSYHQKHIFSDPMILNPATGRASLTGRLRSARTACCGRSSTFPSREDNSATMRRFLRICGTNMCASMGQPSMTESTRSIMPS